MGLANRKVLIRQFSKFLNLSLTLGIPETFNSECFRPAMDFGHR